MVARYLGSRRFMAEHVRGAGGGLAAGNRRVWRAKINILIFDSI